ncbi:MAG: hypothetical protein KAI26_02225, partial [Nanoarchaeota archaeon]|nr:hypothetical protein [Nanoarchaeota archaeon]
MIYKHTQIGYLIIFALLAVILLFVKILTQTGFTPLILATMIFILFLLFSFISLTVMIDKTYLRIRFGYG